MAVLEDFLNLVLPWQGTEETTYKSIWSRFKGDDGEFHMYGRAAQTLEEVCKIARYSVSRRQDTYVALGTQRMANEAKRAGQPKVAIRTQTNIVSLKTLFLDVDAGTKNYPDTNAALAAVAKFCVDANIPDPTFMIGSGSGGLHVYWVLDLPIPTQQWQPLANALAEATQVHGLLCDRGVTIDCARILRIPESFNYKSGVPLPVRMEQPKTIYTVAQMHAALKPYMGPMGYQAHEHTKQEYTDLQRRFIDGMVPTHTDPVELLDVAAAGCGVIADAIDTGGAAHDQALWHLMVLASTFDSDPRALAHMMSSGYPRYSVAETDAMLARKLKDRAERDIGWPSCFKLSKLHHACRSCPFLADNKSPFHILLKPQEQPSDDLPTGYFRNQQGHVMTMIKPKRGDEQTVPYPVQVLPYQFWDARLDDETGDFVCKTRVGGDERFVYLPIGSTNAREQFTLALQRCRVFCVQEAEATEGRKLFMSWIQKLQDIKKARITPATVGWDAATKGFTYDKRTYTQHGDAEAFVADDSMLRYYKPTGDAMPWRHAVQIVLSMGHPALEVLLASAFAGPLVTFTGMPGLLLSAYSQESGVGKSTALKIAQAVWGHPVKGMNALDDTTNFIIKKLADVQSLPLFWDELKLRADIENFVKLLFRLTQGKDKSRLDRNSAAREVGSFQTLMVAASNDSVAEAMGRATDTTTAGANRVFEIIVPPGGTKYSVAGVSVRIAELNTAYGHAGLTYAQFLGGNAKTVRKAVEDYQAALEAELGSTQEERFWVATMVVLIVGAAIAVNLGLAAFDMPRLKAFLVDAFHRQRAMRIETTSDMTKALNVEELLGKLIAFTQNRHMLVTNTVWRGPGRPTPGVIQVKNDDVSRLQDIWVQLGKDDGILRVACGPFARWLVERGYSPQTVYTALEQHYWMKRIFATLGAGTNNTAIAGIMDRTQQRCMDIVLPDPRDPRSPRSPEKP